MRHGRLALPAHWPVVAPLALFGIAMILCIIDIYVLRLDERLKRVSFNGVHPI